jgi:hypothetical protein
MKPHYALRAVKKPPLSHTPKLDSAGLSQSEYPYLLDLQSLVSEGLGPAGLQILRGGGARLRAGGRRNLRRTHHGYGDALLARSKVEG